MGWEIEGTDQFQEWYADLSARIEASRHANMKELRVQAGGRPLRIFFAFDPRRTAIRLLGGDKTGDKRFYERLVPQADELYDEHLSSL